MEYKELEITKKIDLELIKLFTRGELTEIVKQAIFKLYKDINQCEEEQEKIKKDINNITDFLIKNILKKRIVEGKTWEQVAYEIGYSVTHTQRIYKKYHQST